MGKIDPANLGKWFEAYAPTLVLYVRQWLAPPLAEDAVQDVFARLSSQATEPPNVKAWLFRSVRNAALSRLRSDRRRRRRERRAAGDRREWFDSRTGDLIDARAAQAALVELPDAQRETIILRIWAGMTLREVSRVTGQSIPTAWRNYHAGLTAIRERLESSCKTRTD